MFTIKDIGNNYSKFYSHSNLLIAEGYERIVYGNRGPYIEFCEDSIKFENVYVPDNSIGRITSNKSFYIEYRSKCKNFVKIYLQKRKVNYADYKIGLYYISPYELKNIIQREYQKNIIERLFK